MLHNSVTVPVLCWVSARVKSFVENTTVAFLGVDTTTALILILYHHIIGHQTNLFTSLVFKCGRIEVDSPNFIGPRAVLKMYSIAS